MSRARDVANRTVVDDSVTLAKMASGTDGQIITYDASGNPSAVGPGTDGQVLTSTGAGSPPAFETIPSGATISMQSDAVSCSSSGTGAEFTGLNTSSKIIIVTVSGIGYASGAGQGGIQIGTSSAYVTSGYYGGSRYETTSAQANSHDTSHIGIKNIGTGIFYGSIKIERLSNNASAWLYQGQYYHNGHIMQTAGGVDAGGDITRLKVVTSSGDWGGTGHISVTQLVE